jgi:transposase
MEKINYLTVQNFKKKYGSESACLEALLHFRMSEDNLCFNPLCKAPILKYYHILKKRKCFICSRCLRHFYVKSGSIFDHSHTPINIQFEIIFKILYTKTGVSAAQLQREYGISYKSVFKMLHKVRELMQECLDREINNTQIEHVEIDESFCPTGKKGLGKHFPFKRGRGSLRNSTILVIMERKGFAKMLTIPNANAETIIPIILQNVPLGTTIYTDAWPAYKQLESLGYKHAVVNHSKYEYVNQKTGASTNNAEGIFSSFKRMLGTYRSFSESKLQNYTNEACFRHTFRTHHDYGFENLMRCLGTLSNVYGNTLTEAA